MKISVLFKDTDAIYNAINDAKCDDAMYYEVAEILEDILTSGEMIRLDVDTENGSVNLILDGGEDIISLK